MDVIQLLFEVIVIVINYIWSKVIVIIINYIWSKVIVIVINYILKVIYPSLSMVNSISPPSQMRSTLVV